MDVAAEVRACRRLYRQELDRRSRVISLAQKKRVKAIQESQDGLPNLEDRGAQLLHSLDGTQNLPLCDSGIIRRDIYLELGVF